MMARAFDRLKTAYRKLTELLKGARPGMIGTPPSKRRVPEDPMVHVRQFANDYADKLENYAEERMHALDVPESQIGLPDRTRGIPWEVFHPDGVTGGAVIGDRIAVNSGVLNPELLTERYGPSVGKTWARSRLRDRIDAVIAHELAEASPGAHESAEELAAHTDLAVSEGARWILWAVARRGA
jgi:hypothetical protein